MHPTPARQLLREWLELAAHTDVVPEWPGSRIGACRGTLFVGSNTDVVRAAVWATSRVVDDEWPVELLATLARRGETHNGAPGLPEALSLKVATAAVDALIARGGEADRRALLGLAGRLQRRELLKKVNGALTEPDQGADPSARRPPAGAVLELLRLKSDHALSMRATELVSSGHHGEAVVVAALGRARGVKPYVLVEALGSASPGGEAEEFLRTQVQEADDPMMRAASLLALVEVQKKDATPLLAQIVATRPGTHLRVLALHLLAKVGDRRGRQTALEYFARVLSRKGRQDMVPPLVSLPVTYLLGTADGPEEVEQVAQLLVKRRANLTALDLRWIGEYWPGEWLAQSGARAPLPDVDLMRRFVEESSLQRAYYDLH